MRTTCPLVLLVALGGLFLMGALPWSHSASPKALAALPPAVADPAAARCLDRALEALANTRLTAVETTIWQHLHVGQLEVQAEGRFLQGPGQRYRLELCTHTGSRQGSLLQVSDGEDLWQGTCNESKGSTSSWQEVFRTPLVHTSGCPLSLAPAERPNGERAFAFTGVLPLLNNLRQKLFWTGQESNRLGEADCVVLTGTWLPQLASILAPADQPWPEALPQQCRLWLDRQTSWPRRVEWIGASSHNEAGRLLVEMELRHPVFHVALSDERMRREFCFDPGNTPVKGTEERARRRSSGDVVLP
jgi:hypothetical protein